MVSFTFWGHSRTLFSLICFLSQVVQEYEDDIVVGDDVETQTTVGDDYLAGDVEYFLRSLGLSAANMRESFGVRQLPTESVAVDALGQMMANFETAKSGLCDAQVFSPNCGELYSKIMKENYP